MCEKNTFYIFPFEQVQGVGFRSTNIHKNRRAIVLPAGVGQSMGWQVEMEVREGFPGESVWLNRDGKFHPGLRYQMEDLLPMDEKEGGAFIPK